MKNILAGFISGIVVGLLLRNRSMTKYRNGIRFDVIADANEARRYLIEGAERYSTVSLLDFYDFYNISPTNYKDSVLGWTKSDVEKSKIRKDRYGYFIDLPAPKKFS